jgi:hypothetical protein
MKKIILILILLSTKLSIGQIVNGGFEVWDTTFTHPYSQQLASIGVLNPYGGKVNHWTSYSGPGICQTTDSYSGNYALILHNWYGYAREWIAYDDSINYSPSFLQGYFKYIKGGTHAFAHGALAVTLTWFNGIVNDTVASGSYVFDTTAVFTPFEVALDYFSFQSPDSIHIYIINATDSSGWSFVVSNLLYLDDLTLSDTPLNAEEVNNPEALVTVFPRLVHDELTVRNNSTRTVQFTLFNSLGEKVFRQSFTGGINTLNMSTYPNSVYFYNIFDSKNKTTSGKIVKQ